MKSSGWTTAQIEEVCELIKGSAAISKTKPGPYPLVTTGQERKAADHYQFDGEIVCVPMISSTGHGRASLKRVQYQSGKFALSNLLTGLIIKDRSRLCPRFLHAYLDHFKDALIVPLMHGMANMSLAAQDLAQVRIAFPSLDQQERIVKLLDEADALRKLRAQADARTADLIPALFNEMFGDPFAENRWRVQPLSNVSQVVSGVAKGRTFNGQPTIMAPYLRVANVQDGYLDLTEIKMIEALPAEVAELSLKRGDVLLTEGGDFDKLGRGAMLEQDLPNTIHQNHIFRVRVDQKQLTPLFFANYLLHPHAKAYFLKAAKKTTNLASINMTQLRALPVPIPPLDLQQAFAVHITEIGALQAQQTRSRRRLDDLFQSMLHKAFQGEL